MTNRTKGVLCILASAFGFALMALFVGMCDSLGGPVSSFQKSFFRNLVALFCALAVFVREKGLGRETVPHSAKMWSLLLTRSVFGALGIFCNFYALSLIPIGDAMTLNKTAPFFVVALSWLFLRERVSARQIFALVLAFCGAALVMKPEGAWGAPFPALCGLAGGFGAGVAYTCVRELGRLRVPGAFIVLFFSAFSCFASVPFMLPRLDPMNAKQLLAMLGAGGGAAIGQFGVTAAYRFAPAREIAIFDYSSIIFTAALGFVFLEQNPDLSSVAGFAVIFAAAFFSRRS